MGQAFQISLADIGEKKVAAVWFFSDVMAWLVHQYTASYVDQRLPPMRSNNALSNAACDVCSLLPHWCWPYLSYHMICRREGG